MRVIVVPVNGQGRRGRRGKRTFDTERVVRNPRIAAKRMVRGARLTRRGRLIANPSCPADGSCIVRLAVTKGGRTVAASRMRLPADMSDRIALRVPKRPPGLVARGRISQVEGSAAASRALPRRGGR
jgi:hypothetical protein